MNVSFTVDNHLFCFQSFDIVHNTEILLFLLIEVLELTLLKEFAFFYILINIAKFLSKNGIIYSPINTKYYQYEKQKDNDDCI